MSPSERILDLTKHALLHEDDAGRDRTKTTALARYSKGLRGCEELGNGGDMNGRNVMRARTGENQSKTKKQVSESTHQHGP
jgi:hypothetical protein